MNSFAGLILSLLLFTQAAVAEGNPSRLVTLDVNGIPLSELAHQLEQQYPVQFFIPPHLQKKTITVSIDSHSLKSAVDQLLLGLPHAVVDRGESGLKVYLFGEGELGDLPQPTQYLPNQVEERSKELVIRTDEQGRYMAEGRVNGVPAQFLVDTGANWLVLGKEVAKRAAVEKGKPVEVKTANGLAAGYWTEIRTLTLGALHWSNVEAIVLPELESPSALLGMNLLKTVDMDMSGERLLLKQSGSE